jgi:hypothetical protein
LALTGSGLKVTVNVLVTVPASSKSTKTRSARVLHAVFVLDVMSEIDLEGIASVAKKDRTSVHDSTVVSVPPGFHDNTYILEVCRLST